MFNPLATLNTAQACCVRMVGSVPPEHVHWLVGGATIGAILALGVCVVVILREVIGL